MQKNWFTIFSIKVTVRAYIIKIWLSTISSKLLVRLQPNLVLYYSIISCSVLWKKEMDYWLQGQGHSEGSVCQWMFVLISSEPQNILLPNMVWWCSIMNWSVMRGKKLFGIFKVEVTARVHLCQNMTLSTKSVELLILWQPNMVWWYIIIGHSVLWKKKKKDYYIQCQGHSDG